jgi:hypothetical protein
MGQRMRGKKTDPVFISQFIQESVQSGMETPDQIVQRAKNMIEQIDEEIKAIETKKVVRSKLLDVIASFEKQSKDKTEEAKLLPLFKLSYPHMCKYLCEIVEKSPIEIGTNLQVLGCGESDPTMKFSIKQLLEYKVFVRIGNRVSRGERFDEYMKFVLGK